MELWNSSKELSEINDHMHSVDDIICVGLSDIIFSAPMDKSKKILEYSVNNMKDTLLSEIPICLSENLQKYTVCHGSYLGLIWISLLKAVQYCVSNQSTTVFLWFAFVLPWLIKE